jgi:hypothetical protein
MKKILLLLAALVAWPVNAADTNVNGSVDIIAEQKPIRIASGNVMFPHDRTFLQILNTDFQFGLRAVCYWTGTPVAPYNNNDCGLFEARNTSTAGTTDNHSWAVSAANAYHSIPAGSVDNGSRVGVIGWATSVNAHGLTHAGTLGEQNGLKGVAGFQGDGAFFSPPTAKVNKSVGVKGIILGDSPGATILDARAGEFVSAPLQSTITDNIAVYARASGGVNSNWSFYGAAGRFYNGDKSLFGRNLSQSLTAMSSRMAGNSFEFGHFDTNGYGSTIGATYSSGTPFLAFSAEADPTGNTFTTRGKSGSVISGDLAGGIVFSRLPTASASGQALVESARFNARGNLVLSKNPPASSTSTCSAGEQAWDENYTYVCVAANTWKRAALSSW